jgi:cytochrome P450
MGRSYFTPPGLDASIDDLSRERTARPKKIAPGPRGAPIVGSAITFGKDPRLALMNWAKEYGPLVRFRLGPMIAHVVAHPDAVKHVLQDNNDNYTKAPRMVFLADFLGQSLLTMEGSTWKRRRRLAQPAFHRERLAELSRIMAGCAEAMVEQWQARVDSGQPFDVAAEMMRTTLSVVGKALFGVDLSASTADVGRALPLILDHILGRLNAVIPMPLWMPTPANHRYHAAVRGLDEMVFGLIRSFRSGQVKPTGLMAMLMDARDQDTGVGLTDQELRDEIMTLIFAGHETISCALSWTFWLLAQHPEAARRLRDELADVLGDRPPAGEDLPRLRYTQNAINESMRLMPPSWGIARMPLADDEIDGCHIPAGSMVLLAACATHRDPALWDNPDTFDPDRFSPERSAGRHRMAFYPFSAGPRVCIAGHFSMMEATLIVAAVMQRFDLRLDPAREVKIETSMTLRPKDGLWMTLHRASLGAVG